MKSIKATYHIVMPVLLLAFTVHVSVAHHLLHNSVVCLGSDGHVAIELTEDGHTCVEHNHHSFAGKKVAFTDALQKHCEDHKIENHDDENQLAPMIFTFENGEYYAIEEFTDPHSTIIQHQNDSETEEIPDYNLTLVTASTLLI